MSAQFNPRSGLVIVRAHLWGPVADVSVRLALDTGAVYSMIDPAWLMYVGYDPATTGRRVQICTASGIEYAPLLSVARLAALDQEQREFSALGHALPSAIKVDGLLGLDFLRDRELAVNFRAGTIVLR